MALVKEGFVNQFASALKTAEESANSKRLEIWNDYIQVEKEHIEEKKLTEIKVNYEEIVVTEK